MDKMAILSALKEIKPVLAGQYGLTSLALFGSYSRSEQTAASDIDLLIDFKKTDADAFFGCVFTLQDLFPGKEVQIVTRQAIKPGDFKTIEPDLIYA